MKKNIGIAGLGYWGKNLVRNFADLGVLHGICDIDNARLHKFDSEYQVEIAAHDYADLLKCEAIEAIVIATPAATHYKLVKSALEAGKDVFVEKPLALHVEEAEELERLAQERGRILMVDHILLYHPALQKLKNLIDDGSLGELRYIYSNRLNIGLLRKEENILWSFAPHDISVILHLTGQRPHRVEAFGEAYLQMQNNIYDTTLMNLTFANKLKAHIYVSWLHPFKEQKLVVIGSKNMAVFNDVEKENKLILYPHRVDWIDHIPVASKEQGQAVDYEVKEPLREACLHFLTCVAQRMQPLTDAAEARNVLSVIQQAQDSLERNIQHV